MNPGRMKVIALFPVLLALLAAGCGSQLRRQFAPNQTPEIQLDPPVTASADAQALAYSMTWRAQDSDGRVDHYLYALDPPSLERVDETWTLGREPSATIRFARRSAPGRAVPAQARWRDDFHVFAVRAVDEQGLQSASAAVALFEDNIAPSVYIENPRPNAFFTPIVTTSPTITWRGTDPDGHIVRYKYRLFTASNPDFPDIPDFISLVMQNPDTLRELYGPSFASWDSVAAGIQSVHYTNLPFNQIYLFAIIAIDNRGAYSAVFSPSANMLKFAVAVGLGPVVCVYTPFSNFCQPSANSDAPAIDVPAGSSVPVSWIGIAPQGTDFDAYRYALDPAEPLDGNRSTWTAWSLENTATTVGPFAAGEEHVLVVQARDQNELVGTLRLPLVVVQAGFDKELLVVDDTRLTPDQLDASGGIAPPRGPWPTAAELDTFLYARGGFPWRGYPEGTLSPPGILAGYAFDTLGTRGLAGGTVPFTLLSRYRHVIWMTDDVGATYFGSLQDLLVPITSLRLMSSPGQQSPLAAYVGQGGKLWLQGGGAAYATLAAWNRRNTPPDEFTNSDLELVEGRFMYDLAHWRSGIRMKLAQNALLNVPEALGDPTAAPGRGWPGQPPYQKLATRALALMGRTCATDPPSPLRVCNSFYLVPYYTAEFLFQPNAILEDIDPRPNHETFVSALDTLYVTAGGTATPRMPVMTYYHGSETTPMVFSGFPIWYFQRQQCADLTDFVLQDIWGLARQPGAGQTSAHVARRH